MSMMKSDRRPPLAKSPTRIRPRRVLRSSSTSGSVQTPPGSLTKSMKPSVKPEIQEPGLRPEYQTISCELKALARKVEEEFGNGNSRTGGQSNGLNGNGSPLFERGRFYEMYSARRNERLKRKKGETEGGEEERKSTTPYMLGVTVESSKKRDCKKLESLRKSVSAAYYSVERSANPRYSLRSLSKENKKPPLPINVEKSLFPTERKVGTARRTRKI